MLNTRYAVQHEYKNYWNTLSLSNVIRNAKRFHKSEVCPEKRSFVCRCKQYLLHNSCNHIHLLLFIYSYVLVEIIKHKVHTQNVYYLKNKKENKRIRDIIKRYKNILVLIVS